MRNRNLYLALLLAVAVAVPVHTLEFPGSVPDFTAQSGGGKLLDTEPAFSQDEIYSRLHGYGAEGRRNYFMRNLSVDILLPLAMLPLLLLLARRAIESVPRARAVRALVLALPVAYVGFDFAENASVLALLASYPERREGVADMLPYFTVIKRGASLFAIVLPLVILSFAMIRRRSRRISKPS